MKILVAEDDPTTRIMLGGVLKKWGYEVVLARDGNEAWSILSSKETPNIALLDWEMPGLAGIEVCRRVRANLNSDDNYVYIILLTAKASKDDIVTGIEVGADDYIVKPFDPQELRVRIRAGQRIIELQSKLISARDELKFQATHDPLTGVYNRGAILERLEEELSRAVREGKSLTLAMIDIDHFKRINDTYGHKAGDIVLCEICHRVRSVLRVYDAIGRYGGEEFLVIIPGTNEWTGKSVCERIRRCIEEQEFFVLGKKIQITVSLGAVTSSTGINAEELIRAADKALYQAKANGRNRVEYANAI
ncbi:diguanylate cyclase [Candidatus Sumerlaeota bacterium]|nr:diguanylate cyclase [Candidatus Sumerlaeota bacterium]